MGEMMPFENRKGFSLPGRFSWYCVSILENSEKSRQIFFLWFVVGFECMELMNIRIYVYKKKGDVAWSNFVNIRNSP